MKDAGPQPIYLKDYTPPAYLVDDVHLTFQLSPNTTRVISRVRFCKNPDAASAEFFLHGEDLRLMWAKIDGVSIAPDVTEKGLTCDVPANAFTWEAEVEIDPANNTALEGLYMSNGMYCTQCEAEGFRKITYFPDRPDVMAVYTVRIESDLPVLLSNGNPTVSGAGFAEWHDPWPKPSYLFALVAGDLIPTSDQFTTASGKDVALNIYARKGDETKCAYALDALKRSMTWDENVYGREYDLDIFNIVAVDDFNAGAMENKGLNIFNSAYVLASPETATDANFESIEAVIAHEYFHNWTGNRITCRDWFQLCLKEGLTVFRDQQFTGDMRSKAVKRIDDAVALRAYQFREDNGPLAHPVRPESFVEINNFYTATVYEKGAEVIGMLKRLVGDEKYAEALDLYFTRHDGDAATIEDWLAVFEDVTGRDMTQFKRWYTQAGTPRITVTDSFENGTYTLKLTQETRPTPGQPDKKPQVIPVAIGLLAPDGTEVVPTTMLELTEDAQSFTFEGLTEKPVPSILRDFSAPVIINHDQDTKTRAFLLAHDTDPFNRWEAGHALATEVVMRMVTDDVAPDPAFLDGLAAVMRDDNLDPAFRARIVGEMPRQDDIAQRLFEQGRTPDPMAIYRTFETLKVQIALHLQDITPRIYAAMQVPGSYSPAADAAGKRSLGNIALSLMSRLDGGKQAAQQYATADNMTQQLAALSALLKQGGGADQRADFFQQWRHEKLVMDKWFAVQVGTAAPEDAAATVKSLTKHPLFDMRNPNRFRAVLGAFSGNAAGFHMADGSGYNLLADWLIKLDPVNPQTAARMTTAFDSWKRYDANRQAHMVAALQRILKNPEISGDVAEMITRLLDSAAPD
ncbi:aminopeptidase N [Cognatiyoonia koreensis]|uniref:Aminopeptidase N n=1 Tax=Cognatiyoonia koreensis TaxID=364200 RepID=A0A1I0Q248_9RHOB|nr:aminopeptidase N [Cognatiyoonia koreensis]SEW20634.1 aminopeptidase N [Cognatiyoonia koreensis]